MIGCGAEPDTADEDADTVRRGELRLLDHAVRAAPAEIDALLADDFIEFGSSGAVFDKAATVAGLQAEAREERPVRREVSDLAVRSLGPDAMLVTYQVIRLTAGSAPRASLRSSVWRRTAAGWRMLFHQGTPMRGGTISHTAAVAAGYDRMADEYLARFGRSAVRDGKLAEAVALLRPGAAVLDLGCGAGLPVAKTLAAQGFAVTGVDVSRVQIERAISNVPGGRFIHGDIGTIEVPAGRFDAVLAFYVLPHVARADQPIVPARIARWLKPGGVLIASFGVDEGDWSGEWLGVEMHFSHHAPDTTRRLIEDAGLLVATAEIIPQDNEATSFLWITARLPA